MARPPGPWWLLALLLPLGLGAVGLLLWATLSPAEPEPSVAEEGTAMELQPPGTQEHIRGPQVGYMRIFGYHGQFANQLVAIAKAYALAQRLNRTLVEPELMPSAQLYYRGGRPVPLFRLFDEATLRRGPVPLINAKEYSAKGIHGLQREYCHHKLCWCCENYIKGNPRWDTVPRCNCSTLDVDHRWPGPVEGLVLHPGFAFSSPEGNALPCDSDRALFKWLQPTARVGDHLRRLKSALPANYLGAHVRFTKAEVDAEEYCRGKMRNFAWWYASRQLEWRPTGTECLVTPAAIACHRPNRTAPFFFSGDQKNASVLAALAAIGGLSYTRAPTGGDRLGVGEAIVLDMMALRDAAVFLGNPLSSFSGVVCSMRRARTVHHGAGRHGGDAARPETAQPEAIPPVCTTSVRDDVRIGLVWAVCL